MATVHNHIYKILGEIIDELNLIDHNLEHMIEGSFRVLDILNEKAIALKAKQVDLKFWFYKLLSPIFQASVFDFDLSQLQDEVFREIGEKREDEMVGLLEDLKGFKKRLGDEVNERMDQLREEYDVEPKCSESKEIGSGKNVPLNLSSLADSKEVGQEKSQGLKGKEKRVSSPVGIAVYGFPLDIALDMEASLGQRKLIQDEGLFYHEETKIGLDEDSDEDDEREGKDAEQLNWVRVNKLKKKFEELKEKLYRKEEPKVSNDDKNLTP